MVDAVLGVSWGGAPLTLLPQRAVWWDSQRALILADAHLGKPAAFRAGGAPTPEQVTRADLARLAGLVEMWRPREIIVAGDFLHARSGLTRSTLDALAAWRTQCPDTRVVVVQGNHDRAAGPLPEDLDVESAQPPLARGGLAIAHDPQEAPADRPTVCGHLHPGVSMAPRRGGKGGRLRAPCFWLRRDAMVLPAFGGFTGLQMVRPARGDRVMVVGDGRVVEVETAASSGRFGRSGAA